MQKSTSQCLRLSTFLNHSLKNWKEKKFQKILIANRGEIACRIIRTCNQLGIKTVAIYSDWDSRACHVKLASEARYVGPATHNNSGYQNIKEILNVAKETNSDAVHPGYGFLSENAEFARFLDENGVKFIGPHWQAIHFMGNKLESKRIAKNAGLNVIPGYDGVVNNQDECLKIAKELGYPVVIKALVGAGGKGMRIARNDEEAVEGFRLTTQEANSSFGDPRLLVEKFITNARHIEIQVLCDQYKNAVHLNERECSIQRRNQKVIEEAPSTFVTPSLRSTMGENALAVAAAIGYDSAGTVEFLVDSEKNFYFLEMNTRIQVEHPVTELITGIDIVREMIQIAEGFPLKIKQENVTMGGWAVESRIYAEDPYSGLPCTGRLSRYKEPLHISQVRCDSGVQEGSELGLYYDPLICKLLSYGNTRQEALDIMVKALDSFVIRGVTHNISLIRNIITESSFANGIITTDYLKHNYPDGFKGTVLSQKELKHLAAIAGFIFAKQDIQRHRFLNQKTECLRKTSGNMWHLVVRSTESLPVSVYCEGDSFSVKIDGDVLPVKGDINIAAIKQNVIVEDHSYIVQILQITPTGKASIQFKGTVFDLQILTEKAAEFSKFMLKKEKVDTNKMVIAPMPGLVKSISCEVGKEVAEGQEICSIEAMKMQISLTTSASGVVKVLNCSVGDKVDTDQVIAELY